jgi:hypothetical protein
MIKKAMFEAFLRFLEDFLGISFFHSRPVHQGTEHQLPSEAVRPTGSSRCQAETQELDLFLRALQSPFSR